MSFQDSKTWTSLKIVLSILVIMLCIIYLVNKNTRSAKIKSGKTFVCPNGILSNEECYWSNLNRIDKNTFKRDEQTFKVTDKGVYNETTGKYVSYLHNPEIIWR